MAVTHDTIAKHLNLARSTVTRILNNDPNYRASKATRERVFAAARMLDYDFANLRRIHRRRFERVRVQIRANISVVLDGGQVFDKGDAIIMDLNPVGALLAYFHMPRNTVPIKPFELDIEIAEGDLAGLKLRGQVARMFFDRTLHIGVEFVDISDEDMQRIATMVGPSMPKQNIAPAQT